MKIGSAAFIALLTTAVAQGGDVTIASESIPTTSEPSADRPAGT